MKSLARSRHSSFLTSSYLPCNVALRILVQAQDRCPTHTTFKGLTILEVYNIHVEEAMDELVKPVTLATIRRWLMELVATDRASRGESAAYGVRNTKTYRFIPRPGSIYQGTAQ